MGSLRSLLKQDEPRKRVPGTPLEYKFQIVYLAPAGYETEEEYAWQGTVPEINKRFMNEVKKWKSTYHLEWEESRKNPGGWSVHYGTGFIEHSVRALEIVVKRWYKAHGEFQRTYLHEL